ncbi:DASH complex subunit dad2 [Ophidiomyces ophidiicola]|nr:DASH complex subunit dad2 [Ophidiomyces ophidiicola]KAI1968172.1 DASH complex subunit dad2 [Ophidiomyces ophidiicola]KAI2014132.1 DASH complex subunit dad2 [Ophidiomyces ophidiicola]KAI2024524.1 DASH complex subunit dad2 [Ophidiomyces ophidiicola]KAI2092426.1 DASH complex subunit dad2 [Ophidiomyces ophidiicola]
MASTLAITTTLITDFTRGTSSFSCRRLLIPLRICTMAHGPRPTGVFSSSTAPSLRQSGALSNVSTQQSSILAARVAAKRSELDDLKQLREVSGALATQMEALNQKLETLRDGAEGASSIEGLLALTIYVAYATAVACVMANWENVLRAINMASIKASQIPPVEAESASQADIPRAEPSVLPAPLVRIPAEPLRTSSSAPQDSS